MITKKHWVLVGGLVAALAVFGVLVAIADSKWAHAPADQSKNGVLGGQASTRVTVEGEIVCLPKKGDGPHTMECALGIKDKDGHHYAVTGSKKIGYETGKTVRVSGTLKPADSDTTYDIVGTIAADK